ncbi:hypothetical protein [Pseudoteredinibacter isoporae]|uniref:FtsH-binding integral membrane protein n=1 Tax=Pseudoteredinibacter isoporae TaxID=570281 RepID=A0A7X0MZW5_9GAMM|nr:hypothetical protein [Pseudoteredinibacter isoporae]MBB6523607.1 FtsH-binding integral membrane protein [Pseudoteredinibacter isoporae]NHO89114.1 hypothetical protein [Pseudoteredinibacter isoporae]NIB22275.1 hypothetical protein [Pseudoteredinibacter isoporae]
MNLILLLTASGLCLLAGFCFYLASPNQQLRKHAVSTRGLNVSGLLLSILALISLLQFMGTPAAIFLLLTLMMFVLTLGPLLIAYLKREG